MRIKIFVEGKADHRFIEDLISNKIKKANDTIIIIIPIDGKDKLSLVANQFRENTIKGGVNIIIFDADNNVTSTHEYIMQQVHELDLTIAEVFLFPNNLDPGDLEVLLLEIRNPDHNDFFECFNLYENCLKGKEKFFSPALKTKIFAYVDTLNPKRTLKIAQEEHRDYSDSYYWNLDSPQLVPLIDFLTKYL